MYGSVLEKIERFYFLGIYFGQRESWRGYISQVVNKCKKVVIVMRRIVGQPCGADFMSMKYIDNGSTVYGSAAKSALTAPDMIEAIMGDIFFSIQRRILSLRCGNNRKKHDIIKKVKNRALEAIYAVGYMLWGNIQGGCVRIVANWKQQNTCF